MATNQPSAPSALQGPSSIPAICFAVNHQQSAATAKRSATSPARARVAANAGARPRRLPRPCSCVAIMPSGGHGHQLEVPSWRMAYASILERFASDLAHQFAGGRLDVAPLKDTSSLLQRATNG